MKKTIQTRRNKPSGSKYRVLYAKTGRKRRLHAATVATVDPHADLESDVPNMRVGRALLVILVLHIVAIAAVYIHSNYYGGDDEPSTASKTPAVVTAAASASKPGAPAAAAPAAVTEPAPELEPASQRYIVSTGDTYHRIAQARNVDERSLRALNSNRPLRAGVVLDLPAELSSRPVVVSNTPSAPKPKPAVVDGDRMPKSSPAPFRAKERYSDIDVSHAPRAIVVKPTIRHRVATGVKDSGKRYTIKSGDTLWRISNRFKVSRDSLLKLNGIKNPNKLYAGRTIKIPVK